MATPLNHFRNHLVAQSLVRDPNVAGALPPAWIQPKDGVPEPGAGNGTQVGPTVVVGLMEAGGIPAAPQESEWRQDVFDVVIRATSAPVARQLAAEIRRVTIDRRNWRMGDPGGMTVMQSLEFRPFQPLLPQTQHHTFIWGVLFQYYAEDAA